MMNSSLRQRMTHDLQLAGLSGALRRPTSAPGDNSPTTSTPRPIASPKPNSATISSTSRAPRGRVRADVGLSEPSPSEAVRKHYPCGPRCGRATGFLNRDWRSGFAESNPL